MSDSNFSGYGTGYFSCSDLSFACFKFDMLMKIRNCTNMLFECTYVNLILESPPHTNGQTDFSVCRNYRKNDLWLCLRTTKNLISMFDPFLSCPICPSVRPRISLGGLFEYAPKIVSVFIYVEQTKFRQI